MADCQCLKHPFGCINHPKSCGCREAQLLALVEAMDQLLNDMGPQGLSVCNAAKAQARIAFEPFRDPTLTKDYDEFYMTLAEAKRILAEANY